MGKDDNCDHFGVVDFGEGPTRVMCTQVGEHDQHICEVILGPVKEIEIIKYNVFEEEDGG